VQPSQHRKALFWRTPLAHRRFDSASLLPSKERGVHGETFDRMSFKFGATWRERYFAWLVWAGNPSPLPLHRAFLIACHSEQSSSSICVKASKESRSHLVACNEVAAFRTEAGGCDLRSAERSLKVVLNFCLGLYQRYLGKTLCKPLALPTPTLSFPEKVDCRMGRSSLSVPSCLSSGTPNSLSGQIMGVVG